MLLHKRVRLDASGARLSTPKSGQSQSLAISALTEPNRQKSHRKKVLGEIANR